MKLPNKLPRAPQGSFGMSEDMRKALSEHEKRGVEEQRGERVEENPKAPPVSEDDGFKTDGKDTGSSPVEGSSQHDAGEDLSSDEDDTPAPRANDPISELKKIGVDLTDDDIHQYCFKGYLEKEVPVMKTKKRNLTVTLRTLTGEQYIIVDRKLADIVPIKPMTREGLDNLRSLYVLSYGVTALSGNPLVRVITGGVPKDQETIGDEAFEALTSLSSGILNKIMRLHAIFSTSLHLLVEKGDSPFLNEG